MGPGMLMRSKPYVESAIHMVFYFAGAGTYGPKWLAAVALGLWIARALLLRAIWRHEDAKTNGH